MAFSTVKKRSESTGLKRTTETRDERIKMPGVGGGTGTSCSRDKVRSRNNTQHTQRTTQHTRARVLKLFTYTEFVVRHDTRHSRLELVRSRRVLQRVDRQRVRVNGAVVRARQLASGKKYT